MNKIKMITFITLLVITLVVAGCSGPAVRDTDNYMEPHTCVEEVAQLPWYETESIDLDWIQ